MLGLQNFEKILNTWALSRIWRVLMYSGLAYNTLEKNNLIQTRIIIIRYYSNTNLVKRGLISACSESANNVIEKSNILLWNDIYSQRLISQLWYFGIITRLIEKLDGKIIKKARSGGRVLDNTN